MPIPKLADIPVTAPRPGSRWRHWREKCIAVVHSVGYHSETGELLVIYLEMTSGLIFARPLSMWTEITASGAQRFTPMDTLDVEFVQDAVQDDDEHELCECGRQARDCAKADDPSNAHGDREEEPEHDDEYEERREIVAEVSRRVGGLTSSEVRDIMAGD